ncbi:DUF916 domain-containing protein [Alkalibacillus silvisoli]|uniref:DUF916 domain-containing protein n=1 Tax=Alkalibacillus silvisoli TaxID=392823 RepID=A0ABN0ZP29_9BACI
MRYIFLLIFLFLFCASMTVSAEQTSPVSINLIYPDNHIESTTGYFDLNVEPGEQQEVHVELINNRDEELTVIIEGADAYTDPNGGIMYGQNLESFNSSLLQDAYEMSLYIDVPGEIVIEPLARKTVPIKVDVPDLIGQTVLGGLRFVVPSQREDTEETGDDEARFIIQTDLVYAIATQLNLPEQVESNFTFNGAGFLSSTGEVYIGMQNDAHKIQDLISGKYSVLNEEGIELFSGTFEPFNMAPKSSIHYPISWDYESLEEGTYTLNVEAKIDEQGDVSFSDSFTIGSQEIDEHIENNQSVTVQHTQGMPVWGWILILILAGGIFYLLGKRRRG